MSISHWLNLTDVNGIAVVDPRLIHSRKHSEPRYVTLGPTYFKASQRLCLMTCPTPIRLFTAIHVDPTHPPHVPPFTEVERKTISNTKQKCLKLQLWFTRVNTPTRLALSSGSGEKGCRKL